MILVLSLLFVLFYIWFYYQVGVYATPLGGAFLLGWAAYSVEAHWMIIAGATIAGWLLVFFILGFLRALRRTWPLAGVLEVGLIFVPSAVFTGGMVHMLSQSAGQVEAIVLSVIAGVFVGVVACQKHEARMGPIEQQDEQGAAE